jgi:hypothetical protein
VSDRSAGNGGITFLGGLLLLFVGLKLGGKIDWSWVWVMSPAWVPFVLVLVCLIGAVLVSLVGWILSAIDERRNRSKEEKCQEALRRAVEKELGEHPHDLMWVSPEEYERMKTEFKPTGEPWNPRDSMSMKRYTDEDLDKFFKNQKPKGKE